MPVLEPKLNTVYAGQIAGMVKKEQPAAEIVQEIAAEAEALLKGAAKWVK